MSFLPTPPVSERNKLKKCDVENCPCCNAITRKYARPKCYSGHDAYGNLSAFTLHWNCDVCGGEWAHGQFEAKGEK